LVLYRGKNGDSLSRRAERAGKGLKRAVAFLSLFCLFFSGSCGYQFVQEGSHIDPALRSIFVPAFPNQTDESTLGNTLRESLILELRKGSRFQLAAGREDADLLLLCELRSYETYPVSYGEAGYARENRIHLTVDLTLENRLNGTVLWSGRNMAGTETYGISLDPRMTEKNRRAALGELARDLAERAYRVMTSGF